MDSQTLLRFHKLFHIHIPECISIKKRKSKNFSNDKVPYACNMSLKMFMHEIETKNIKIKANKNILYAYSKSSSETACIKADISNST